MLPKEKSKEQESELKSAEWYLNRIWFDGHTRMLYLEALLKEKGIDPDGIIDNRMKTDELTEKFLKRMTKEPVTTSDRESYRGARYTLKTIVPILDKPYMTVYPNMTQDELDAYFEGYNETAEFVISLEKEAVD